MRVAVGIELDERQKAELVRLSRSGLTAARLAERSKIVLLAAQGWDNQQIAEELGMTRQKAGRWRLRFAQCGIAGIEKDAPRPGRLPTHGKKVEEEVVRLTLQEKPRGATHWSRSTMARASGLSESSVGRIWKEHGLKPHLAKTFKLSNDKSFVQKLEDVVGLYVNAPEHAVVFSCDEKSQIQALDRTQPGLPLKKGRCGTMTHDYKRHGTTSLFAALDVASGKVIGMCQQKHRHQEWIRFLNRIKAEAPKGKQVHPEHALHTAAMEYRNLGPTGLQVSALSFGAWVTFGQQISDETAAALMLTAYEGGVNFFDNAEAYAAGRAEIVMGKVLKEANWPRDTWCVSSKVFWGPHGDRSPTARGLSRKHVFDACHAALQRLQVDYLDLYFCHRPDLATPIEETVAAMSDLIRQGKVLYWGTSEWTARDIAAAHAAAARIGGYAPVVEQSQYNLFHRERVEIEYSRLFRDPGMGITAWSPLASGLLTGKYLEGTPGDTRVSLEGYGWMKDKFQGEEFDQKLKIIEELANLANELEVSMPRLALAWCMSNKNISTTILGASKVSQLKENLKAVDDLPKLTPDILNRIEKIAGTKPTDEPVF